MGKGFLGGGIYKDRTGRREGKRGRRQGREPERKEGVGKERRRLPALRELLEPNVVLINSVSLEKEAHFPRARAGCSLKVSGAPGPHQFPVTRTLGSCSLLALGLCQVPLLRRSASGRKQGH